MRDVKEEILNFHLHFIQLDFNVLSMLAQEIRDIFSILSVAQ